MFIREQVYHDLFNLGALFFLVILNLGNWTLSNYQFMWTGNYFETVKNCFFIYFSADTIWIYLYPKSVKSPWVIYIHHLFSLVGLSLVPDQVSKMVSTLVFIEINTWLLICRRLFNNGYLEEYKYLNTLGRVVNTDIKLVSILFYISWIYYRLIVMPQILYSMLTITLQSQSYTNIGVCIIHGILTLMGIKWSKDLLMSKINKQRTSTGL